MDSLNLQGSTQSLNFRLRTVLPFANPGSSLCPLSCRRPLSASLVGMPSHDSPFRKSDTTDEDNGDDSALSRRRQQITCQAAPMLFMFPSQTGPGL